MVTGTRMAGYSVAINYMMSVGCHYDYSIYWVTELSSYLTFP